MLRVTASAPRWRSRFGMRGCVCFGSGMRALVRARAFSRPMASALAWLMLVSLASAERAAAQANVGAGVAGAPAPAGPVPNAPIAQPAPNPAPIPAEPAAPAVTPIAPPPPALSAAHPIAPVPAPTAQPVAPVRPSQAVGAPAPPKASLPPPSAAADLESPEVKPTAEPGAHCLLSELCFGPVLTLGVLDVFGVGLQARTAYFGVSFDYQFFHFSTRNIPITLSLLSVEARVYPFAGAFFLSGGLAWQHAALHGPVHYAGDSQIPAFDTEIAGRINVPVLKLGIGFMGRSGFILGTDLAFGIQLGSNTVEFSTTLPQIQQVIDVQNQIRNRADKFVRGLPFLLQLNALRIGYLF